MNSKNFLNNNNQENSNFNNNIKNEGNQNYINPFYNINQLNYPSFENDNNINQYNNHNNNNYNNINNYNQNYNNYNLNNKFNNFNINQQNSNYNNINNNNCNNYNNNLNNNMNYNNYNNNYYQNNNNKQFNSYDKIPQVNEENNIDNSDIIDLIKTMAVLNSTNNNNWKDSIKSFVSTLYYNGYSYGFSKKFDKDSMVLPLYIFNNKINNVIRDEILFRLKSFIYMSYRSTLINLSNLGLENCTSDCGWGCMLRCCQMLLSKGLIQKKIFDFFSQGNGLVNNDIMTKIRKEVLCLFHDNYLNLELVREHPDFENFWRKYENIARNEPAYNSISEIIPPYSIHILCKLGNFAGKFTSNIKIINLLCKINSYLFNNIKFLHFESGDISRKQLLNSLCEECIDFNNKDIIEYNGVDYQFKNPGIIFISLRLGLYNLDPSFYDFIPLIFSKFRNNFGFVGGKKDRAYYFIGVQGDNKLIFVDPHLNQQMNNDFEKDYESYYTENLYLLDIKELTSSFTFAIGIFNSNHFSQFIEDLKWFDKNNEYNKFIYFGKN